MDFKVGDVVWGNYTDEKAVIIEGPAFGKLSSHVESAHLHERQWKIRYDNVARDEEPEGWVFESSIRKTQERK